MPSARLATSYIKYRALYDFAFEKRSPPDMGAILYTKFQPDIYDCLWNPASIWIRHTGYSTDNRLLNLAYSYF